jgi:hypothetical protein
MERAGKEAEDMLVVRRSPAIASPVDFPHLVGAEIQNYHGRENLGSSVNCLHFKLFDSST